jgi:hypothetical protein
LASLTGLRDGAARRLLGRLCDAARKDHKALSELLDRATQERPSEPVSWLMAGAKAIAERSTADDPWGLRAWYASAPNAQQWPIAEYEMLLQVAGFQSSWRGSLAPLTAWIEDGYRLDSVVEIVADIVATFDGEITSLKFFDTQVRKRAARWDAARCEWRVG